MTIKISLDKFFNTLCMRKHFLKQIAMQNNKRLTVMTT